MGLVVRAVVGLNYPDGEGGERRVEPGELVADLPAEALEALLAQGAVERVPMERLTHG